MPTVHGAILPSIRKTPYEQIEEPLGPSPNGLPRTICRTIEIDIRNA